MNFKRFHESGNLLDYTTVESTAFATATQISGGISISGRYYVQFRTVQFTVGRTYTMLWKANLISGESSPSWCFHYSDNTYSSMPSSGGSLIAEKEVSELLLYVGTAASGVVEFTEIMLNEGSEALPYEPYSSEVWHDIPYYQHKTATDTLTLPAVIYPNDTSITVGLKGNEEHTGTPSPQNPVMPNGTGERTGNLFDYNAYFDSVFTPYNEYFNYAEIQLQPNTTYALSTSIKEIGHNPRSTALIVGTSNEVPTTASGGISNVSPITKTTESDGILKLYKRISGTGVMPTKELFDTGDWLMLNTGSTPLPYEPYGYKIPISSANTTTPVYLGEVETTRRVKKLVLTGQETWVLWNGNYFSSVIDRKGAINTIVCSHFVNNNSVGISYYRTDSSGLKIAAAAVPFVTSVSELREWLAAQYAAGTPVCVWYVLATEETAVVNEPIRKIGDYADEVSGITIPTSTGKDTFDVQTTLKPSEVSLSYTGWHDAKVKELNNLLVDNPLCGISTYKDTLNLATGACTRKIKKLVLRGNESFSPYSFENTNGIIVGNVLNSNYSRANGKCSHYTVSTSSVKNTLWIGVNNSNLYFVGILTALGIEYNQFASWVAQQYAAGTPVTIWYVLATPTTETIAVPSGLSGTEEGYLNQSGTPTPTNPIYPTANNVGLWQ